MNPSLMGVQYLFPVHYSIPFLNIMMVFAINLQLNCIDYIK